MASHMAATASASPSVRRSAAPGSSKGRGGGDTAANASVDKPPPPRALDGRAQFAMVWLDLMDTQAAAARTAAALPLPSAPDAALALKELLGATQRVSRLVKLAHELLYMHVIPDGRDDAQGPSSSSTRPASPARALKEPSHAERDCCCCCCLLRAREAQADGSRGAKRGGQGPSTRSTGRSNLSRGGRADSDSDGREDAQDGEEDRQERRGRRRGRGQRRRRTRREEEDEDDSRDRSSEEEDAVFADGDRLHNVLVANRIRGRNAAQRMASPATSGSREPAGGRSAQQRSSSSSGATTTTSATPRGRSPARTDRTHGAGFVSPGRRQHRRGSVQSLDEPNNGKKRKRSPVERQVSPSHRRASPRLDSRTPPPDDGVMRMSKAEAADLTAEKVLGVRRNFSQTEFKIKWIGLVQPSWIARRKCPPQAIEVIEAFTKTRPKGKRSKKQHKASSQPASQSTAASEPAETDDAQSETLFTVDKLIGARKKHNRQQFLVRWEGYDSSEDTWEYVGELRKYVPELVEEFEAQLERERKRQANGESGQPLPRETAPPRDDDSSDDEGEKEPTRQQITREEEDEDEDEEDEMDQRGGSGNDERNDHHSTSAGGQITPYRGGRFNEPMYFELHGSGFDDDGEDGDDHELDDELDEDEDEDDHDSVDFGNSTGVRSLYAPPAPSLTRAATSTTVMESAKELLRRLRA